MCQLFPNIAGATADRPGADVCQPCRGDLGGKRRGLGGIGGAYEARLYVDVLLFNHDYDYFIIYFDHDYFIYFLDMLLTLAMIMFDVQLSRPPCTCPGTHASCNGCAEPSAEVSE